MAVAVEAPSAIVGPSVGDYFEFHDRLYFICSQKVEEDGKHMYEVENCETLFKDWINARTVKRIEVIIPYAV